MKTWQVLLIVVLFYCGGGFLSYLGVQGKGPLAVFLNDPFTLIVDYPTTVAEGEEFSVEVETMNSSKTTMKIGSVDLSDEFLVGFEILSVVPSAKHSEPGFGFLTWYFDPIELAPGASTIIKIQLRAKKSGYHTGDLDVCTPVEAFTTHVMGIRVSE